MFETWKQQVHRGNKPRKIHKFLRNSTTYVTSTPTRRRVPEGIAQFTQRVAKLVCVSVVPIVQCLPKTFSQFTKPGIGWIVKVITWKHIKQKGKKTEQKKIHIYIDIFCFCMCLYPCRFLHPFIFCPSRHTFACAHRCLWFFIPLISYTLYLIYGDTSRITLRRFERTGSWFYGWCSET